MEHCHEQALKMAREVVDGRLNRPVVLTFTDYFEPGFRGGGPIRSLVNIVGRLGDEIQFLIVTRDRDLGAREAYPNITPSTWMSFGSAYVKYLPPDQLRPSVLRAISRETPHDVVYLNSLFSTHFTVQILILRFLGLVPRAPTILAPRGELAASALRLKRVKKALYLQLARFLGLHKGVTWQASSEEERALIRKYFVRARRVDVASVIVVPDISEPPDTRQTIGPLEKQVGDLRVLFLARIARIKNLIGALTVLREIKGSVLFDIYGPREDQKYWRECLRLIQALPPNVKTTYRGSVPHDQVRKTIANYHLYFLPTLGESYGHGIIEALMASRPVLISDRTPWTKLEKSDAGWDLPIEEPEAFVRVLERCVAMNQRDFENLEDGARRYASGVLAASREAEEQTRRLLLDIAGDYLQRRPPHPPENWIGGHGSGS